MAQNIDVQVVLSAKDNASGVLNKFKDSAGDVATSIKRNLTDSFLGLAGGAAVINGAIYDSINAFSQQEDAVSRLTAGLTNVQKYYNQTHNANIDVERSVRGSISALEDQASTLQKTTRFADEQILSGQAMLTTFQLNTDSIKKLTPSMLDMAEAMRKSTGETVDLEQVGILLGKAMGGADQDIAGLSSALRRMGVIMTEADQNLLKTGTQAERVAAITRILDLNFGGFAQAGGKTFSGQMTILNNQIGEVKEAIGGLLVKALQPAFGFIATKIVPSLQTFTKFLEENKTAAMLFTGAILGLAGVFAGAAFVALLSVLGLLSTFGAAIVAIGIGVGVVVALIASHWKTFQKDAEEALIYVQGKLAPFIKAFEFLAERIKQILQGFGISGDFGGLINFFDNMEKQVAFKTARVLQIVGGFVQEVKNKMAGFQEGQGNASWIDAFIGVWERLKPIMDGLQPIFDKIGAQLAVSGQIIQTQLVPAWNALMESLGPFLKVVGPPLLDLLAKLVEGIAIVAAAFLALAAALITGFVTALANALPYVLQALEGLIQFLRGFIQFLTGIFQGNIGLVWEGIKQMFAGGAEFIVNSLTAVLKFIKGFVEGFIGFFKALYDALVGHSIIPDIVNGILGWFGYLLDKGTSLISNLASNISGLFGNLVGAAYGWGSSIVRNIINGIKNAVKGAGKLAGKIAEGLGVSLSDLLNFDMGGVVPGPIGAPQLAVVHGGEEVVPFDRRGTTPSQGGSNITLNVSVGLYAGSEIEKRNIASQLYDSLARVAAARNQTVQEMMGR